MSRHPGEFRGPGPTAAGRSDLRIREDVCERLTDDPLIDPFEVSVRCERGRVTLEGVVKDRRLKHRIENLAASALGVTRVDNRIRVARAAT